MTIAALLVFWFLAECLFYVYTVRFMGLSPSWPVKSVGFFLENIRNRFRSR